MPACRRALPPRRLAAAAVLALAGALAQAAPDAPPTRSPSCSPTEAWAIRTSCRPPCRPATTSSCSQVRDTASDMVLSGDELPRRALPPRRQLGRARASTAAASRATCSRRASAWCCRAAPTSRPARRALSRSSATSSSPATWCSSTRCKRTFSHVGIYIGDGKFIHAPRTGGEVRVEDMRMAYWAQALHRRAARRSRAAAGRAAASAASSPADLPRPPAR